MTTLNAIRRAALGTLAVAGLWALAAAPAAEAQVVADDVQCNQCVGKGDIADKAVTAAKIKSNSVFSPKIQDRSIATIDIGVGQVGSDELADDSMTADDRLDEPGAGFAQEAETKTLTSTPATVRSIDIESPAPGYFLVTGSGTCSFQSSGLCTCSVQLGANDALSEYQVSETGAPVPEDQLGAFRVTGAFATSGGTKTFKLICLEQIGEASVINPAISAIFLPTRY